MFFRHPILYTHVINAIYNYIEINIIVYTLKPLLSGPPRYGHLPLAGNFIYYIIRFP